MSAHSVFHPRFWLPHSVHRLASPNAFIQFADRFIPWLTILTLVLFLIGLPWSLAIAPPDYQQGDSYRIIFIHVPAAALGMGLYVAMAFCGAIYLIWHINVQAAVAKSCAPVGAAFTFLALVTGALWGKPMWGPSWVWDARLTSTLILFFLYLGYLALQDAIEDPEQAERASALLALVGVINIPIIKYSVDWWYTLHQPATLLKFGRPSMAAEMLYPLLVMLAACSCFAALTVLQRTRNHLLERKLHP